MACPRSPGRIPYFSKSSSRTTSGSFAIPRAYAQEKLQPRVIKDFADEEHRPDDFQRP